MNPDLRKGPTDKNRAAWLRRHDPFDAFAVPQLFDLNQPQMAKKNRKNEDRDTRMGDRPQPSEDEMQEIRARAEAAAETNGGTIQSWINLLKSRYTRIILLLILLLGGLALSAQQTFVGLGGAVNFRGPETAQGVTSRVAATRIQMPTGATGYYVTAAAELGAYSHPDFGQVNYSGGSIGVGITDGQILSGGLVMGFVNNHGIERAPNRTAGSDGNFAYIGFQFLPAMITPKPDTPGFLNRIRVTVPLALTANTQDSSLWGSLGLQLEYQINQ